VAIPNNASANLGLSKPPVESFPFPTPLKSFTKESTVSFLSKDLGPILFNLADAQISDQVTISGNRHALVLSYSTDLGEVEIAVPALQGKERDKTLFRAIGKPSG
jgi:hypothetical protein